MFETIRRAFREFLAVPTLVILGFLLLAVGLYALDLSRPAWLEPARAVLRTGSPAPVSGQRDVVTTSCT